MVSHIHITVEDDLAEQAKTIKDEKEMSWPEFLEAATEEMRHD